MGLDTHERQKTDYFVGIEVENTAMKGEKTLFIVGVKETHEIIKHALANGVRHLYFGTSQSFKPKTELEWSAWTHMIRELLDKKFWCTLDFGVEYAEKVLDMGFDEYDNYISMISVKLPYIRQFNYNATVKLDDTTWGHSNPGVWCHSLHSLQRRSVYTDWKDYKGDEPVE
tara:strand:+ start:447 stop:959 length:513 start_codon:yes stop_codon:yes gene_type:complete